jgi:hypothetical protein
MSKITSIGVVEAGDNPEATIELWKSKPETPAKPPPVVQWANVAKAIADHDQALDEAIGRIDDSADRVHQLSEERNQVETYSAEEIAAAVDARARAMLAQVEHWEKSRAEVRADLWRKTPQLHALYSAATRRDPDEVAKSGEFKEALATFRAWRDDPTVGL